MPTPHALITGSSRGLGLSIAHTLAQSSYRCTLLSRSAPNLRVAVSSLPSPHLAHTYIVGDIRDAGFWTREGIGAQLAAQEDGGRIDVLVNCAGITQKGVFTRTLPGEIEEVVGTNLTALMQGTRFLLRNRFIRGTAGRGGGEGPVIINVASLLGRRGGYGAVVYSASKAGVLGFTRALATEVGRSGIRVNAIVPGYVETDMTAGLDKESLLQKIPLQRFGRPSEIADAALFLAKNQYAHNCIINLDGGLSAM